MNALETVAALAALHHLELAPDLDDLQERLSAPIGRYAELELRSEATRVDLVTLQERSLSIAPFLGVLRRRGLKEGALKHLSSLARFGAGATQGMKLPLAGPLESAELYIRAPIAVGEASAWLKGQGVGCDALRPIADAMGKDHLHILAVDAEVEPVYTVFFTRHLEPGAEADDARALGAALGAAGIPEHVQTQAHQLHELLGAAARPETFYFSAQLGPDGALGRVKMDYVGLRVGLLAVAAESCGHNPDLPLEWAAALGRTRANYAGVAITHTGAASLRAYFTMHTSG